MAFRGYYDNTLDAKNRLTIPAKLRRDLADGVVAALQRDAPCVSIWRAEEFGAHVERLLENLSPLSEEYGTIERFYNGYSAELELDAAGRVMVPSKLLEQAGLGKEVAVIGAGNRLEVWDREAWRTASPGIVESVKRIGPGSSSGHTS